MYELVQSPHRASKILMLQEHWLNRVHNNLFVQVALRHAMSSCFNRDIGMEHVNHHGIALTQFELMSFTAVK
jgi:hypothetical protein